MICGEPVWRRAHGVAGLGKTTSVMEPCGREATVLMRGLVLRDETSLLTPGTVYLQPWRPQCNYHARDIQAWEREMRAKYPVGIRPMVAFL